MYRLLKPIFFLFDPEKIHHFVVGLLQIAHKIPGKKWVLQLFYTYRHASLEKEVFGIKFPNPVGLAAGFDKDAKFYKEIASFGFGFVEIGTLTPKPQDGNPKPRMFRLRKDEALINRMGFNNDGVDAAVERLKNRESGLIIGGNIGKNKNTPNEEALNDYLYCYEKLYHYVDYFVVNVSSPNTPGLRALQEKEPLKNILISLMAKDMGAKKKPILLKIAPDLTNEQLDDIIEIVKESNIAGVIATNTTIDKNGLYSAESLTKQAGGLSGKPLTKKSTEVIKYLHTKSNGAFPIIGVGGIHSAADALEKLEAGASLVQIYTGFIYEGPGLVKRILKGLIKNNKS